MKVELKIPSMGESIQEVTIGRILQKSGTRVDMDAEVMEIETDKLNQVLYAQATGTITILVKEGDRAKIGDPVAVIDAVSATVAKEVVAEQKEEAAELPKGKEGIRKQRQEWFSEIESAKKEEKQKEEKREEKKERISLPSKKSETRKPLSTIRKTIAKRLVEVKLETAMLTTFNEVDMSQIIQIREKHKETFQKKFGVKLGFMSFFVKAVVDALKAYPVVNSYLDGDASVLRNYYDIGVAVSTDRGLIVPVLQDCDTLSYAEIEKKIEDVATRAKTGKISIEELSNGGFTITNGGTFGSLLSTPILNPSQCAILGMHKIMKRPVVVDDAIVIRPMMYLALSYDHRILDGKEAVGFLVHIKNHLENLELSVLGL